MNYESTDTNLSEDEINTSGRQLNKSDVTEEFKENNE